MWGAGWIWADDLGRGYSSWQVEGEARWGSRKGVHLWEEQRSLLSGWEAACLEASHFLTPPPVGSQGGDLSAEAVAPGGSFSLLACPGLGSRRPVHLLPP